MCVGGGGVVTQTILLPHTHTLDTIPTNKGENKVGGGEGGGRGGANKSPSIHMH